MTFVSYAQNFEDVMLWRALKHIEHGFYIDVGADSPTDLSVTKAFYEKGWCGINIEPISNSFMQLQTQRPRDTNLQILIGETNTLGLLHEISNTGLSTISRETAILHQQQHGYAFNTVQIPMQTLTTVCKEHKVSLIHFLKIDVEGAEKNVLEGFDLTIFRPWIILIEATQPLSQIKNHEQWEALVLNADYQFVYFDGLNRFYVAKEHPELFTSFETPPNIFDNFSICHIEQLKFENKELSEHVHDISNRLIETSNRLTETTNCLTDTSNRLTDTTNCLTDTSNRLSEISNRLTDVLDSMNSLLNSRSWKLTKPLRQIAAVISQLNFCKKHK